jgi:hypothetical protein
MYNCSICGATSAPGTPQLRHTLYRGDGSILQEIAVCQGCVKELRDGVPVSVLVRRFIRTSHANYIPPVPQAKPDAVGDRGDRKEAPIRPVPPPFRHSAKTLGAAVAAAKAEGERDRPTVKRAASVTVQAKKLSEVGPGIARDRSSEMSQNKTVYVINFSHPLTPHGLANLASMVGASDEHPPLVRQVRCESNNDLPFGDQAMKIVDTVGFTSDEWRTANFIIIPPSLSILACAVLACIHGRCGYFPGAVRMDNTTPMGIPPVWEVAEIIGLSGLRETNRSMR